MKYQPKRIKKTHIIFPLILILCGIVCLGFSQAYFVFMPSILQIVGFVCFSVAIVVIGRFSLVDYDYTLSDTHFSVTKTQGRKITVIAELELDCLCALYPKTKGFSIKDKVVKKITLIQNCCVNIFPEQAFYLVFDTENGLFVLQVELCEEMYFELERIIKEKS